MRTHCIIASSKPEKHDRSCGGCGVCCVALEIESKPGYSTRLDTHEDLAKPAGTPCRYLTPFGCGIYNERPVVCRRFQCDWILGRKGFGMDDRPAFTGVLGVRGVNLVLNSINPAG